MDTLQYKNWWEGQATVIGPAVVCGASEFRLTRELLESVGYTDEKSVLDYGCGWGSLLTQVSPREYIGVDISPTILQEARKTFPNRRFELSEIGGVNIPSDCVVAHSVFTHVPSEILVACMEDIRRSIAHGGFALIDILEAQHGPFRTFYTRADWRARWEAIGCKAEFVCERKRNADFIHSYFKIWQ